MYCRATHHLKKERRHGERVACGDWMLFLDLVDYAMISALVMIPTGVVAPKARRPGFKLGSRPLPMCAHQPCRLRAT